MKDHGLNNTKNTSELCCQLLNFQEKQKTMVLIVPMRCLTEKLLSQKYEICENDVYTKNEVPIDTTKAIPFPIIPMRVQVSRREYSERSSNYNNGMKL